MQIWRGIFFLACLLCILAAHAYAGEAPAQKLILKNHVRATFDGVICEVAPQTFTVFEFDGTYLYGSTPDDRSHDPKGGSWDNLPCGVRYSTRTPGDVGVILDARGGKDVGNETIFFFETDGPAPIIDLVKE